MDYVIVKPSLNMQFNPRAWMGEKILNFTNCYAYALDRPDVRGPHLGRAADPYRKITHLPADYAKAEVLTQLALDDGLLPVTEPIENIDPAERHVFAILGARLWHNASPHSAPYEKYDCHFIRLDAGKTWSEKPGAWVPRDVDKFKNPLQTSTLHEQFRKSSFNEFSYVMETAFAGFFEVPREGIKVVPANVPVPILR